jgi:signal transduction histidine kinase/ligand-binding sensor domain-containing protein
MFNACLYNNLVKAFALLTIILLLASCKSNTRSALDEMPRLYSPPMVVALNIEEGYSINPYTGDSIQPIINSMGDTVITGRPVPARGKVIDPDSVEKPNVYPVGKPKVIPVPQNVNKIPEALIVIPINHAQLKIFTPTADTVLNNVTGDTIFAGVTIPAKGRVMPCRQPQPFKASPPRKRKNAVYNIEYLDEEHGMKSSIIESILEDSHGNIWFGSVYGGAIKYNGETVEHFTPTEGLSSNWIESIREDSHGNLWFGTWWGGVCKYDGETFTHFDPREGLGSHIVFSILEDSHGNLWFGTDGGGVSMYNGETFTNFTPEGWKGWIQSILEDSHGNLWFGTSQAGVSMYNGEFFTQFTQHEGLHDNTIVSILEDSQGNLWFGGPKGVSMYNGESFTHFTPHEGLHNSASCSLEDRHGNLWFGGKGGVSMYNGDSFMHLTEKEGLSNNTVLSILEDRQGNIWFGTRGGGVSIYKGEFFKHFTENEGLSSNQIGYILEDHQGNLWIGTYYAGVMMYNGQTFAHYIPPEGISGNTIYSMLEDSHENLWFSAWQQGVTMYNGLTVKHFTQNQGLSDDMFVCMLEDRHGHLWFGSSVHGGASMYDGETFIHFTQREGLLCDQVMSMLEDSHGNLWFAGGPGVSKYDGEAFTHFTEKEGLLGGLYVSILEDYHGNFWFGSEGRGVSMYNGETFTHFTEKEGLSSNSVISILEDGNHNIWVGTRNGLNRLVIGQERDPRTEKNLSVNDPVIHTYDWRDGLRGAEFNQNAALIDSKNRIWWGHKKGLTMLDVSNLIVPIEPPLIQLDQLYINEQFADYRQLTERDKKNIEFNGVPRFYNYPLNLELPYTRNHLTFHFSAIDWAAPHKIKYSYKMEGVDDRWSSPTGEASADYRNMPYGRYTFKVSAIGAAQKWSEPFEYTFTISPPWWHTWWARAGYGIMAFLLVYIFVQWRTARLQRSKKELEQKVKERTAEIQDKNEELRQQQEELKTINEVLEDQKRQLQHQKEELQATLENLKTTQSQLVQSEKMASIGQLVAGIAHEINNPVTFISAGVDSLNTNMEEVRQVLDLYHKITLDNVEEKLVEIEKQKEEIDYNEAIREINQLIESVKNGTERTAEIVKGLRTFSRLDEDVLKSADLHEGLDSTLILLRSKYKVHIEIEKQYGDIPEIECYPGQLNQVFMNILSNAIDAIDDKGTITISTIRSNGSVRISIRDTGRGIPEDIQPRIFEPFFTTKEVGQGTGLGLSISYSIIEKHHGSIEVNSEIGKGSEFVIVLPIIQS